MTMTMTISCDSYFGFWETVTEMNLVTKPSG